MPGIEDWINSPLPIIQRLFEESKESHALKVEEFFNKRIQTAESTGQLPSLNDVPTHNLPTNSLVRFRAMVQDMYDPEFYLGVYEVENKKSGAKQLRCGKYRDLAECGPQEEIKLESPENITLDRQTYYCIPIPGENLWVKQAFAKQNGSLSNSIPSTSKTPARSKRMLEEDGTTETNGSANEIQAPAPESMDTDNTESPPDGKKPKTDPGKGVTSTSAPDLNFPLPGEQGPACIVKVYQSADEIKLNDVIEVIGVLSNDPAMASFPEDKKKNEKSAFVDPASDMMEGLEEDQVDILPPSLVPRLHAIAIRKLNHSNPWLPWTQTDEPDKNAVEKILSEVEVLRTSLLSVIQKLLFGDHLAAEYLLCHLVSSVYARHDVVAVGKFALNLTGCPKNGALPKLVYGFLKELVTKSHYLAMTIENMNKLKFTPKKDYKANRLQTGVLQLSERTHLVVDETVLQPGQLDNNGVTNMTALGTVISWQKTDYDFNFHQQEFHTDIVTLVLSEGKSILKCDCQLPLVAKQGGFPDDIEAHFTSILTQDLSNLELMDKLRAYLGLVQILPYDLPDELQKEIEQDFVDTRKSNTSNMSVEDFHGLLVLARLLSLTRGHKILTREMWERAKVLEVERKTRLVLTSSEPNQN